jgi:antitoxin (DNA-binding transcriptional repressor) of toxin-antitoxin stability system
MSEGNEFEYTIEAARKILGDLVKDASNGEPRIITYRGGEHVACLVPPAVLLGWIEQAEAGGHELSEEEAAFKARLLRLDFARTKAGWGEAANAAELARQRAVESFTSFVISEEEQQHVERARRDQAD